MRERVEVTNHMACMIVCHKMNKWETGIWAWQGNEKSTGEGEGAFRRFECKVNSYMAEEKVLVHKKVYSFPSEQAFCAFKMCKICNKIITDMGSHWSRGIPRLSHHLWAKTMPCYAILLARQHSNSFCRSWNLHLQCYQGDSLPLWEFPEGVP